MAGEQKHSTAIRLRQGAGLSRQPTGAGHNFVASPVRA